MSDLFQLAIGRILRLASRPTQPGDIEDYERCRALIMALADEQRWSPIDHRPNDARNRLTGAQGD